MTVRKAKPDDAAEILREDRWFSPQELARKIAAGQVLVLEAEGTPAGFLRYGLFWDSIPFMNMLRVRESCRGKGYGSRLVSEWEREMKRQDFHGVMTSTAASETAQHFYQKLGYTAVGSFFPPGEPLELILFKAL